MSDQEFTDDQRAAVISTWRKIQGSPDLLDGLLFGEFEDFIVGVFMMLMAKQLHRQVPLGLIKRSAKLGGITDVLEFGKELLNLPVVKKAMDDLMEESE